MVLLKEIEIKNYRGLRHVVFSPKSINIIVGPNNVGKSSILEAVGLLLSSKNNFKDILLENNIFSFDIDDIVDFVGYLINFREYPARYLIRVNAQSSVIRGTVGKTEYSLHLEYIDYPKATEKIRELLIPYLKKEVNKIARIIVEFPTFGIKSKNIEKIKQNIFTNILKQPMLLLYLYKVYKNRSKEICSVYVHFDTTEDEKYTSLLTLKRGVKRIYSRKKVKKVPLVLNFSKLAFASDIEGLYDIVVEKGKILSTIRILTEKMPYISDIRKTEKGIYIYISHKESIPLSSMGDGFITLLKLSFLVSLAEKGVIILEEPEVSLHPAFLDIIAEEIVNNSDSVQFFISTHSLDFLYSALERAEEKGKLNEINVIRLHRKRAEDTILVEILDGREAKRKIDEIGLDLRQT